LPDYPPEIMDR